MLPAQFAELEPYVAQWVAESDDERLLRRLESPLDEVIAFYQAVLPRFAEMMAYLAEVLTRSPMDGEERTLFTLAVAFVETGTTAEFYAPMGARAARATCRGSSTSTACSEWPLARG